jgi:hypothetical protein
MTSSIISSSAEGSRSLESSRSITEGSSNKDRQQLQKLTTSTPPSNTTTATKSSADTSNDNEELPSYPTGSTVPFPYATPYQQQVDLMESLLQGVADAPAAADTAPPRRTKLVMLESPTGKIFCTQDEWTGRFF